MMFCNMFGFQSVTWRAITDISRRVLCRPPFATLYRYIDYTPTQHSDSIIQCGAVQTRSFPSQILCKVASMFPVSRYHRSAVCNKLDHFTTTFISICICYFFYQNQVILLISVINQLILFNVASPTLGQSYYCNYIFVPQHFCHLKTHPLYKDFKFL